MAMTADPTPITRDVKRIPDLEEWLDERGIPWTLEPALRVEHVDAVASLANQARLVQLNEPVVDQYAADMERGEKLPPIVVRKAGRTLVAVGGNHRLAAARRAGIDTLAAYVIEVDDHQALLLSIEDNRRHGLPLTDAERIHHAVALVNGLEGGRVHSAAEAAEICGIALAKLRNVLAADRARARCADLDLATGGMSLTTLAKLDSLGDDELFGAAVDAVATGAVLAKEVGDVVARLREAPSTKDALAFLHEFTGGADGRVRPPSGHPPSAKRQPRARLLIDLDRLLGYDPAEVAADCRTPEQARQIVNQINVAARRLKAIQDAVKQ
jgi:uncharacterized ParB-like nuclease family protein